MSVEKQQIIITFFKTLTFVQYQILYLAFLAPASTETSKNVYVFS